MVKTNDQLHTEIVANFPDNTAQAITPALLRTTTLDLADSAFSYGGYLTTDTTVQAGSINYCDTSGGAFNLTLPASPTTGTVVSVRDAQGTWGTSNLSILPGSNNIESVAATLTCDTSDASFDLVWRGGGVGWGIQFIIAPLVRKPAVIRTGAAAMHGTSAFTGIGAGTAVAGAMSAAGVGGFSAVAASTVPANWNPSDKNADVTLSGSNLIATRTGSSSPDSGVRGTPGRAHTHRFFEITFTALTIAGNNSGFGLSNGADSLSNYLGSDSTNAVGVFTNGYAQGPGFGGNLSSAIALNDIIGIEIDSSFAGEVFRIYKNGSVIFQSSNALPTGTLYPALSLRASDSVTANFGATAFSFPATGATAWNAP